MTNALIVVQEFGQSDDITNSDRALTEERGQDMVEYALLLSFMVALALGIVTSLRVQLSTIWSSVSSAVSTASS